MGIELLIQELCTNGSIGLNVQSSHFKSAMSNKTKVRSTHFEVPILAELRVPQKGGHSCATHFVILEPKVFELKAVRIPCFGRSQTLSKNESTLYCPQGFHNSYASIRVSRIIYPPSTSPSMLWLRSQLRILLRALFSYTPTPSLFCIVLFIRLFDSQPTRLIRALRIISSISQANSTQQRLRTPDTAQTCTVDHPPVDRNMSTEIHQHAREHSLHNLKYGRAHHRQSNSLHGRNRVHAPLLFIKSETGGYPVEELEEMFYQDAIHTSPCGYPRGRNRLCSVRI